MPAPAETSELPTHRGAPHVVGLDVHQLRLGGVVGVDGHHVIVTDLSHVDVEGLLVGEAIQDRLEFDGAGPGHTLLDRVHRERAFAFPVTNGRGEGCERLVGLGQFELSESGGGQKDRGREECERFHVRVRKGRERDDVEPRWDRQVRKT